MPKKPVSPYIQPGPTSYVYKVILPTGEQGVAASVKEALECATNTAVADWMLEPRRYWTPYRVVLPEFGGRTAPVARAKESYEQCTVHTQEGGELLFEVYRARVYATIKSAGHADTDVARRKSGLSKTLKKKLKNLKG